MSGETLTTYTVDCTPPDRERRTLRVRGGTEAQALMGAYDYLARQWDGIGWVHEETLTPIEGEPVAVEGGRP